MLKNKIWIVALLIALTMVFIGCTDAGKDWEEPVEAFDENVLQITPVQSWAGLDLNNLKFKFQPGDIIQMTGKTVAANQLVLTATPPNWDPYVWQTTGKLDADTEFDTGKKEITAEHIAAMESAQRNAIRLRGNVANATFIVYNIVVTRGTTEVFNLKEAVLNKLEPGETDWIKIFDTEGIGDDLAGENEDRSKHWMSQAAQNGTAAKFMILGPGIGGEAPPEVPNYKGDPDKVRYVANATDPIGAAKTEATDIVIDFDPSITGDVENPNTAISKDGWAKVGENSILYYKFPAGVFVEDTSRRPGGPRKVVDEIDFEKVFDNIKIEVSVRNADTTSGGAGGFKASLYDYTNTTTYKFANDGTYAHYVDFGTQAVPAPVNVQTWPAAGSGGIAIRYNYGDRTSTGADSLEAKITKVTFTKGTRYKVEFFTPQVPTLNDIADIEVLAGKPAKLPKTPEYKGWVFIGWFDTWDSANQQGTGTQYTDTKVVNSDLKLYAKWLKESLITQSDVATANDTLFTNGSGGTKYTYDSKSWWILKGSDFDYSDIPSTFTGPAISATNAGNGSTSISFDLSTLVPPTASAVGITYANYSNVKITYDVVLIAGKSPTTIHSAYPELAKDGVDPDEDGEDVTYTRLIGTNGVNSATFTISFNAYQSAGEIGDTNYGIFLLRITKIELIP